MRKDIFDPEKTLILKNKENKTLVAALVFTMLLLGLLFSQIKPLAPVSKVNFKPSQVLPDFSIYTETEARKEAFFNYLRPVVQQQNLKIMYKRRYLESLDSSILKDPYHGRIVQKKLRRLAESYRVEETDLSRIVAALKLKIDTIPESLVLVQAANESAWGVSRFAKEANNLFGQWCYEKGCGLVPNGREPGQYHEVRRFDSPSQSVASYMKNLNSHPAYKEFRALRAKLRERGEPVKGSVLAGGLMNYSEKGRVYIQELIRMIQFNQLE